MDATVIYLFRKLFCTEKDVVLVGISSKLLDQVSRTMNAMDISKQEINVIIFHEMKMRK